MRRRIAFAALCAAAVLAAAGSPAHAAVDSTETAPPSSSAPQSRDGVGDVDSTETAPPSSSAPQSRDGVGAVVTIGDLYDGGTVALAPGDELRVRLASRGADSPWAFAFGDASIL